MTQKAQNKISDIEAGPRLKGDWEFLGKHLFLSQFEFTNRSMKERKTNN